MIFRAWMEDWETENIKNNGCIIEAKYLEKYENLVFLDPDIYYVFAVVSENVEYQRSKRGGWHVIGKPNNDNHEMEEFGIELANELIVNTPQADDVEIVRLDANQQSELV